MAEAPLVDEEVRRGRRLIELLDDEGLKPKAAFWLYRPDTERWRLVIATDEARKGTRELYLRALRTHPELDLANVEFQTPDSPFVKAMGRAVRVEGLSNVRMQENVIDGVYVKDALIYRMAA